MKLMIFLNTPKTDIFHFFDRWPSGFDKLILNDVR